MQKEAPLYMFDWILNVPLGIIVNVSDQSFLLLDKFICFLPVEKICFHKQLSKGFLQNRCLGKSQNC